MTDSKHSHDSEGLLERVWAEARDLIRRLEGSSVQRVVVEAGETRIEVERGAPAAAPAPAAGIEAPHFAGPVAPGAGPGPGISPGGRTASGAFAAITDQVDNRVPVLAPLVGTFYRASQPGSKPFVDTGDVVELGQTVCIVEAMKMMNEVAAGEGGKVVEIVAENGEAVEFEQVLMYLEPVDE
jgi:acetyl-CoA carboxylase biotin carboxyl carrier protein